VGHRVVFNHAKGRRLFFSCFHPELCAALRLKQAVYVASREWRVKLVLSGVVTLWPSFAVSLCAEQVPGGVSD
jgi:hypothetical protein